MVLLYQNLIEKLVQASEVMGHAVFAGCLTEVQRKKERKNFLHTPASSSAWAHLILATH